VDTAVIIAIVVIVAIVAVVGFLMMNNKKKESDLKEQFGPEYEREIQRTGSKGEAQKELEDRKKRVRSYTIVELSPEDQRKFSEEWRLIEAHFVDDPGGAVKDADEMVGRLMVARGYPMSDSDTAAADISVDHPEVVSNYRSAHVIVGEHEGGRASTEALRQAMMHYRAVADELLGTSSALGVKKAS
jgi:hypothetical protein